jgi:hypothetical protein
MISGRRETTIFKCLAVSFALACAPLAVAQPWAGPGDVQLRHDLQRLADAGILKSPVLSWPLPWQDVRRDLEAVDAGTVAPALQPVLERVRARLQRETRSGDVSWTAELAGAAEPEVLRTFADTPREEGEAAVAADWVGDRFAWRLEARVVADPDDDETFRPDGSYVAASLGNWFLSAGYVDRWWGPGWDGSLILSTNARPVPAVAIDRLSSQPFDVPVLKWLGPWRFSTFMGQLESERDYAHALLFGMRAEIRPLPSLQLAASRTAQWCGEGRPCGFDTFKDLLFGNDNDQPLAEQPGNQLAGFDVRWTWPGGHVPLALYAQAIGEDEAGSLPSKYLGLFGAETWGAVQGWDWRARVEYADTACDFVNSNPQFGCAYENSVYTSGYRFHGRPIGHAMDGDGETVGFGAVLVNPGGHSWEFGLRHFELNREGRIAHHSLVSAPTWVDDLSLTHERGGPWGKIRLTLGYADSDSREPSMPQGLRGSATWTLSSD